MEVMHINSQLWFFYFQTFWEHFNPDGHDSLVGGRPTKKTGRKNQILPTLMLSDWRKMTYWTMKYIKKELKIENQMCLFEIC